MTDSDEYNSRMYGGGVYSTAPTSRVNTPGMSLKEGSASGSRKGEGSLRNDEDDDDYEEDRSGEELREEGEEEKGLGLNVNKLARLGTSSSPSGPARPGLSEQNLLDHASSQRLPSSVSSSSAAAGAPNTTGSGSGSGTAYTRASAPGASKMAIAARKGKGLNIEVDDDVEHPLSEKALARR